MKEFKINEQQLQQLWNMIVKFPAIKVLPALDMIRNLPVLEELDKKPIEG